MTTTVLKRVDIRFSGRVVGLVRVSRLGIIKFVIFDIILMFVEYVVISTSVRTPGEFE